jgi:hypothetical protein
MLIMNAKRETVDTIGKWAVAATTVAGLLWGMYTTVTSQALETRRPFLELQLKLYQEATEAAATLATSTDELVLAEHEGKFWRLYWGVLAMVENGGISAAVGGVEGAMVRFGRALNETPRDTETLQRASLALAHACRDSLAVSWGVPDWAAPEYTDPNDK